MIKKVQKIIYGITEKKDGNMKLILGEHNAEISENRREYFKKQGMGKLDEVAAEIIHGSKVKIGSRKDAGNIIKGIDGLITTEKNLILAVTMADCLPIYFYNTKANIIAIAHAGWRGLRIGIVENMLSKLKELDTDILDEMKVYVGPHIKDCHFEVKSDVLGHFDQIPGAVAKSGGKKFLSLAEVCKYLLVKQGIKEENIKISRDCTYCEENRYFSFRRDKPEKISAQMAFISIKT